MPKIFQSIQLFDYVRDASNRITTQVNGVHSREGEALPFSVDPVTWEGRVEVWLQKILDATHATIRSILEQSLQVCMGTGANPCVDQDVVDV